MDLSNQMPLKWEDLWNKQRILAPLQDDYTSTSVNGLVSGKTLTGYLGVCIEICGLPLNVPLNQSIE